MAKTASSITLQASPSTISTNTPDHHGTKYDYYRHTRLKCFGQKQDGAGLTDMAVAIKQASDVTNSQGMASQYFQYFPEFKNGVVIAHPLRA